MSYSIEHVRIKDPDNEAWDIKCFYLMSSLKPVQADFHTSIHSVESNASAQGPSNAIRYKSPALSRTVCIHTPTRRESEREQWPSSSASFTRVRKICFSGHKLGLPLKPAWNSEFCGGITFISEYPVEITFSELCSYTNLFGNIV